LAAVIASDPHTGSGGGLGRKSAIRCRMPANSDRGTATVRSDPCTVELELDATIEGDPKRFLPFNRRVSHPRLLRQSYRAEIPSRIGNAGHQNDDSSG
jgi:hypothetical protein